MTRTLVTLLALASIACQAPSPAQKPGETTPPATPTAPAAAAAVTRMAPGAAFPAGTYTNLNPAGPTSIDLAQDLGTRPVLLYYWIAGNGRSEEVFRDLERLVGELETGSIALYGVAVPRDNLATAPAIRNRVQMLGLRSAVLEDRDFAIGKRVAAETVPHISIIDARGNLALTGGGSLAHEIRPGLVLADVIRRAASTGQIETYGGLPRWHPVRELEGRPAPDFRASLVDAPDEKSWHGLLDDDKLNVLIFWSVDCPHCREELPEINSWMRDNPDQVNVVSCARAVDETTRTKTREFCEEQQFLFPTLVDDDSTILDLYRVTSTPTILIIGPDGVIDSAIVDHGEGGTFAEVIERKQEELL